MSTRSSSGNIALHHSAHNNHRQATACLLALMEQQRMLTPAADGIFDYSAWKNNWRKTPVDLAMEKGHTALVKLMM